MSDLLLFVRPPRPIWPFNGPGSAFWPPLAFASLAAAVREEVRAVEVAILDAPALRMGWRTLEQHIRSLKPAYVAIGEEAVSCADGLRLAALAKSMGAQVLAGGCCFGNLAAEVLSTGLVDFVVHGEGERTLVELMCALATRDSSALHDVRGLSFREGDQVVFTGWRDPIDDLDRLPFPAYDLLPMHRYGAESRNHRDFVALELSRGCCHRCSFCVLWRQMGRVHSATVEPCLRTKSPARVVAEVEYVARHFGRKYIGWVDPCFNANPAVPREVSELLLSRGIRLGQSAWVRADFLCRDAASGALDTCVRAGLNEVYIGIERCSSNELGALAKGSPYEAVRTALQHISTRHPQLCTVGSFIYGIEGETPASIRELFRSAYQLPLDMVIFIPLTPLPGTPFWDRTLWDGTGESLRQCSFLPAFASPAPLRAPHLPQSADVGIPLPSNYPNSLPTLRAPHLPQLADVGSSRIPSSNPFPAEHHRAMLHNMTWNWPAGRIRALVRSLAAPDARRRSIARRLFLRGLRFVLSPARSAMPLPAWYES
ncbi:MAG TPA: radical SAM protein [Terriglobales bacterium]|nr:radical SAM protein [Terriglobales bacterium]